tara:strand:- start:2670 stop:3647 length:978 start_codon:yes stop_codon:yes gene_type:complete
MSDEMTAEELVTLYNTYRPSPAGRPVTGYVRQPYEGAPKGYGVGRSGDPDAGPTREEVAAATATGQNYIYTQDMSGIDTRRTLPHEQVLYKYFGRAAPVKAIEAAQLFDYDNTYVYEPSLDIETHEKIYEPFRTQYYTQDLSPALQAAIRREQALAAKEDSEFGGYIELYSRDYEDMRKARTDKLRQRALLELDAMYPGIVDIGRTRIGENAREDFRPYGIAGISYGMKGDHKQLLIDDIKELAETHVSGFESGNPQFYTQRPGYAGETLLDEARRTLTYFRQMYPEDAQSARLLGRYINDVEAKYPMMQGATEFPARSDLPNKE